MTLKAPGAVFRNVRDDFKTGDSVEVWFDAFGRGIHASIHGLKVSVVSVHFDSETLDGFVFYADDSREWRTGIPFECCELLYRHETATAERSKVKRAMDRFSNRFLEHSQRPGGTKPGHTVTRETADAVALQCAQRSDRYSGK